METRLATPADGATLAVLHAQAFGAERWRPEQIASSLALTTTRAWVAEAQAQAQGFILVQITGEEAEILTFCVTPQSRRKGTGRLLLSAALAAIQTQNVRRLFLEVAVDNVAALALYRQAGLCPIGRRPAYYKRDGGTVDAVLMEKSL